MITNIHLKNVATYPTSDGCSLDGLSKVNFLYGTNGTGKTTITKVINDCGCFPECSLEWSQGSELATYVYNEEFVRKNFYESNLPGVFTLGSDAVGIQEDIEEKSIELSKSQENMVGLQRAIQSERQRIDSLKNTFKERCWNERLRYESEYGLKEAFVGFRGSKSAFRDKILSFIEEDIDLLDIDEIREKASTVFAESHNECPSYPLLDLVVIQELEKEVILAEPIVGSEGVEIGELIKYLNNSDWVKRGLVHLDHSNGKCPFCQGIINVERLQSELERFFDETYDRKIQTIRTFQSAYEGVCNTIIDRIESIIETPIGFVETDVLISELEAIRTTVELNIRTIKSKLEKPSEKVFLESLLPLIQSVNSKLIEANEKINQHNATIADLENQKALLTNAVWKHIAETLHSDLDTMQTECNNIQRGIDGRQSAEKRAIEKIEQLKREISILENQVTTTGPTITAINEMLLQFGFRSFSLTSTDDGRFYKIIRADGEDAKDTLSEGEKTFLTFLYFYHSLYGDSRAAGIGAQKVVVIDDPISSLDSNILFIVSTLIRRLTNAVREGDPVVRQLFLLTHNIYFHKEISFKYEGNDFTYWIVKKPDGISTVEKYDTNPVVSMYEQLWIEVKESTGVNIQNTMRRILEYYFKNLGGIKLDVLVEQFDGDQKIYCRSLLSWLHDGSHSISDDFYFIEDRQSIDVFKDVFKKIFELKGHKAHYDMMMEE